MQVISFKINLFILILKIIFTSIVYLISRSNKKDMSVRKEF